MVDLCYDPIYLCTTFPSLTEFFPTASNKSDGDSLQTKISIEVRISLLWEQQTETVLPRAITLPSRPISGIERTMWEIVLMGVADVFEEVYTVFW